jgi:hypothetical protein
LLGSTPKAPIHAPESERNRQIIHEKREYDISIVATVTATQATIKIRQYNNHKRQWRI